MTRQMRQPRIKYLREPGLITAYIGHDPYAPQSDSVILATAERFYRSRGASFSGWVVRDDRGGYSDPINGRADAMAELRRVAAEIAPRYVEPE